jgi:hypothetical protein
MAVKLNFKRDHLFLAACIIFMMGAVSLSVPAQRVRLRANINPTCTTTVTNAKFADIFADGNIAVQGSYGCTGAFIYDITNPNAPVLASRYNPGNNQQFLEAIVVGNRGYFGSGNSGGVHIVDLSNPYSPALLGTVNSTNGSAHNSIHEMMVFNQNGQTYLIENFNSLSTKTIKVINVTNPAAPVFVRDLIPTDPQWVHAMHIRGNRMFTSGWGNSGTGGNGRTEIYDITNIGTQAPTLLGFISDTTTVTAGNSMHSSWSSEDGNYLYSCRETATGSADLRVYDIHNPAVPLLIKKITMTDLGITAVSPHNPVVMGNKLYVSWYQAGLVLFDISNPADPKMIGQYDTWPAAFVPDADRAQKNLDAEPWDMICGNLNRGKNLVGGYDGNWAVYPFLGEDKVLLGDLATGLYIVDVTVKNKISDFDGDGRTDFSKFTPATGVWQIEKSSNSSNSATQFGLSGDRVAAGDYDGDGKSDIAVWRPGSGVWYSLNSSDGTFQANQFGLSTDLPVAGNYDGDGKTDIAVWRPSNGAWYINQSTGTVRITSWGLDGDKPLVGDYDGDGKDDLTIYRTGVWYVLKSSNGQPMGGQFGLADDRPVEGDFDGDAKADLAVFRPSTGVWYVLNSTTNSFTATPFGLGTDSPIPADYDGDGKADLAVYRASEGNWHILRSASGYTVRNFGDASDIPSPSSAIPQ